MTFIRLYSINRRFQQNQQDCTLTVLALLPTATENIVKELPVESLTQELQQKKAARIAKSTAASTTDASDPGTPVAPAILPSVTKEDDTQSLQSFASETFSAVPGREEGTRPAVEKAPRKTKLQLWDEIKITCRDSLLLLPRRTWLLMETQLSPGHLRFCTRSPS